MTFILPPLAGPLLAYLLTFSRVGAMIMLLPALGDAGVPPRVRLALALAVSGVLAPTVAHLYPSVEPAPFELLALIAKETTAGVLVGTMARLIMSALQVAGYVIATQSGLSFAQAFDPTQNTQGALVSTLLSLLGSLLIFESGLHHLLFGAISGSYDLMPPGGAIPVDDMAMLTVNLVASAFALGIQLSAPFIVFGLLVYATFGVLSRLMPQMQVFFLAMPVTILGGLALLTLFLGVILSTYLDFFAEQMQVFLK